MKKLKIHLQEKLPAPDTPRDYFSTLPRLETKRLVLRMASMRDAEDMFAYSSDEEVARHVLWDAHRSLADTKGYLRYMLRQYREGEPSSYVMVLKETGRVIGTIGFMGYDEENSSVEIGYSLSRALWGQGLATEALEALLSLCFGRMRLHRVEGFHTLDNPASGRVMEKCGMTCEGVLRGKVRHKGRYVDVKLWAIIAEDDHSCR